MYLTSRRIAIYHNYSRRAQDFFPFPYSLLPFPYSLFPIPDSLLPVTFKT
ncbi:hypothetical protein [Moorena sp. SIO3I8]|nr:hypothetical protein [Moorena sp. SIO3I8]NEO06160.1 hypothetical protein [Moorena sp. SIO3I8]